jgi:hypothetical protein
MSAEAIARLRSEVDGTWTWSLVDTADLRALLDAHATLEAAHTEALDALEKLEDACSSVASWSEECLDFSDGSRVTARAVLAKAGRR